jgi:hypothetical protein
MRSVQPLLLSAAPAALCAGGGTCVLFLLRLAATALRMQRMQLQGDRGHCLEHRLPYIGISVWVAFFARLVFRFAVFFLALRFVFVFRAGPRAPALRTTRFLVFARFFVFFFFAVIGM